MVITIKRFFFFALACMEKKSTAHARKRKGALDCNPSGYHDCHPLDDHACCCFYYVKTKEEKIPRLK